MAVKTVGQEFVILIIISIVAFSTLCSAQDYARVKGPPHAEEKETKKVGRIGETIKLTCPIVGYPTPMIEWSKNGEKIDYMWERHRTGKNGRSLKIKHANEDDTGIFTCKGINGFGSEEVRIELIVIDPRILPMGLDEQMTDVAPPVFTQETKISEKYFVKKTGETFKISCEALGSPQPEIFWFKNNLHIDDNVHYQRGKSTVEIEVMGMADSGIYTCRARNLIGEKTLNFTLEVEHTAPHAVVTEATQTNTNVYVGEEATLQCKVKSIPEPIIKWLKKLDPHQKEDSRDLNIGQERYRILNTKNSQIEKLGRMIYLNKLVINKATLDDAGMYICFVTNSGFGDLTYKSMTLRVQNRPINKIDVDIETTGGGASNNNGGEPISILIIVIVLAVIVFLLLVSILCCVCLKKHHQCSKDSHLAETQSSTGGCSDVERPFMPQTQSRHHHPQILMNGGNNNKMGLVNKPLPPTPMTLAQWSNAIHPQTSPKYSADSGFTEHDHDHHTKELNQYEVPYAHLLKPYRPPEDIYFTQEAFMQPQNSVVSGYVAPPPQRLYTSQKRYYQEYETQ